MADANTKAVVLDGLTIHTNDAGAEAIARLQRLLADAGSAQANAAAEHQRAVDSLNGQIAALTANHRQALEAKDGEIAGLRAAHDAAIQAKDGEIAALRTQTTDAALDARVAVRTALVAQAKRIIGDSYDATGKTDAEVRADVVSKATGIADAATRGEAFVSAAFDAVVAMAPKATAPAPDPLRRTIAAGVVPAADADPQNQQPSAWERNQQRLRDAWRNPQKEAV